MSSCLKHSVKSFYPSFKSWPCVQTHILSCFSTSATKCTKKYQDGENDTLHRAMENSYGCNKTFAKTFMQGFYSNCNLNNQILVNGLTTQDVEVTSANETFSSLVRLTIKNKNQTSDLEEKLTDDFSNKLCARWKHMNDEQILTALCALCMWPPTLSPRTKYFKKVWNSLDSECTRRINSWTVERILLVGDLWYTLHLSRISSYNNAMINFLANKLDTLNKEQFVQFCFFVNLQRKCQGNIIELIEDKTMTIFKSLATEELGIIGSAFFKTQHKMNPVLVALLIKRMHSDLPSLNNQSVVIFAKNLYYSATPELRSSLESLLDASCAHVTQWDHLACVHMALIMTRMQIGHWNYCEALTKRLVSEIREIRLKDITKILLCLTMMNHKSELKVDFYTAAVHELKTDHRRMEIQKHPHCLIACLLYLSYMDIYPRELLSFALNSDFINLLKDNCQFSWHEDVFKLNCSVGIERSEYHDCQLPISICEEVQKKAFVRRTSADSTFYHKFLMDVKETLSKVADKQCFSLQCVLRHFGQIGIVMHNLKGKPFPVNEPIKFSDSSLKNGDWYYIYVGGRACYSSNTHQPLGPTAAKIRQLKRLHFQIIEIPWFEYTPLPRKQKWTYIQQRLKENCLILNRQTQTYAMDQKPL